MVTATEATETKIPGTPKGRTRKSAGTKPAAKNGAKRTMTDEHKKAIASGREEAKVVDRYLNALDQHKPKRGRKVTPESLQKKLDRTQHELLTATGVDRLNLMQEETDLQRDLEAFNAQPENNIEALEAEFVKVARAYAARKGISKATFVAIGVPAAVLKEAGV